VHIHDTGREQSISREMANTSHIFTFDNESKYEPYNWKRKPMRKAPRAASDTRILLEQICMNDTVMHVWDMLTLRDMFALTFVSQEIRDATIDRIQKTKYITYRARMILSHTLSHSLKNKARDFLELMRDHQMYIGGSSILHGILYERPDTVPWDDHDLDVYIASDASYKILEPKMTKLFNKIRDGNVEYAGAWFYGCWQSGYNFSEHVFSVTEIDVISESNGIECYDLAMCQNSIDWKGKMRSFNMYDIVHMDMNISRAYETYLKRMILNIDHTLYPADQQNIKYFNLHLGVMVINLLRRIDKYHSRGFAYRGHIHEYFDNNVKMLAEFMRLVRDSSARIEKIIFPDEKTEDLPSDSMPMMEADEDISQHELHQMITDLNISSYCQDPGCSDLPCNNPAHRATLS
jgi:hypothetical protein